MSGVKSRETHVTVQCVRLSSASFQSFIASKFVGIPDKTIVYKLTNVHEIDLLTSHAESFEEKWQAATDLIKFVKEMRGRQMRKKRVTSKTCIEKSSVPSVDVHVANNNLVFCCYICICCFKLHQADYHVEEFLIFLFFFVGRWVGGGGRWGGLNSIWWGSTALSSNVFTIWCRILISRPPRVFRHFKCCFYLFLFFILYPTDPPGCNRVLSYFWLVCVSYHCNFLYSSIWCQLTDKNSYLLFCPMLAFFHDAYVITLTKQTDKEKL